MSHEQKHKHEHECEREHERKQERKHEREYKHEREQGQKREHKHGERGRAAETHGHSHERECDPVPTFAVVTCSDTRGVEEDTAGAALEALIEGRGWRCANRVVVKDEREAVGRAIVHAADELKVDVVLTCGGSGLSLRDVTPEATMDVCDRNVPGIAEAMRYRSLQITPHAMLSRALCMQRGRCLVVNLPGSEKAARENWEAVADVLPHAVKMMAGGGH